MSYGLSVWKRLERARKGKRGIRLTRAEVERLLEDAARWVMLAAMSQDKKRRSTVVNRTKRE